MTRARRLSAQEAKQLLDTEGYVYVDVRSVPEFEAGHPSGAFNVPLAHAGLLGMEPNPEFITVLETSFGKQAKLIVGCQAGVRSLQALRLLEAAGFTEVLEQRAGWGGVRDGFGKVTEPGWQRLGFAVSYQAERGRSYQELLALHQEPRA